MNNKERNRGRLIIIFFSAVILIPSSKILYETVKNVREEQRVDQYLKTKIKAEETILSEWTFAEDNQLANRDSLQILLKVIGDPLSKEYLHQCDLELEQMLNKQVKIITYQSEQIPYEDIKNLDKRVSGMQGKLQDQLNEMQNLQEQKSSELIVLKSQIDSLNLTDMARIYRETKIVFPLLNEIAIAKNVVKTDFESTMEIPVAMVSWSALKANKDRKKDEDKLKDFIKIRAGLDTLIVIDY